MESLLCQIATHSSLLTSSSTLQVEDSRSRKRSVWLSRITTQSTGNQPGLLEPSCRPWFLSCQWRRINSLLELLVAQRMRERSTLDALWTSFVSNVDPSLRLLRRRFYLYPAQEQLILSFLSPMQITRFNQMGWRLYSSLLQRRLWDKRIRSSLRKKKRKV